MEVPVLSKEGHKVLSSEYCYGYTDKFGKWNNGFPCPPQSSGEPVYCCGTATEPYCCRKKDDDPPMPVHDQTLLLGVALGTLLVVVLLALGACLVCRRRLLRKNRHQAINGAVPDVRPLAGPLYRMQCGSSSANTYSFSGHESGATTPGLPQGTPGDHGALPGHFSELEPPPPPPRNLSSFNGLLTPCPAGGLHYNGPMPHMEPPPPYQVESPHSTLLLGTIPTGTSEFNQPSFATLHVSEQRSSAPARSQQAQRLPQQQQMGVRDPLYWCTKF
ncbi:protein shisa-2 homolog isoform X1 [Ixodes scapularis]|uniref:protein shisa-2 homolog isoform X1 n=1 Tax=Ixodes scapularis TaxID=6945 RepID=UPI001161C54B|nr:protein shisa-2 homolog isoform X1 [Ixodes scapularis]